jgi:hypothetical protein
MSKKVAITFDVVLKDNDVVESVLSTSTLAHYVDPSFTSGDSDYANELIEALSDAVAEYPYIEGANSLAQSIYEDANIEDILDCIEVKSLELEEDTVYYCKGMFDIEKYVDEYM